MTVTVRPSTSYNQGFTSISGNFHPQGLNIPYGKQAGLGCGPSPEPVWLLHPQQRQTFVLIRDSGFLIIHIFSESQRLSTRHWKTSCGKSWRLNILGCVFADVSLVQFWSVSQALKSTKANGSLLHTERQVEGWIGLQAVICQPLISANLPGAPGCLTFLSHYKSARVLLLRLPLRPSYATEIQIAGMLAGQREGASLLRALITQGPRRHSRGFF